MKIEVDIRFAHGALLSAGMGSGALLGLYLNETIGFLVYVGCNAAYVAFHFLATWENNKKLELILQKLQRQNMEANRQQAAIVLEPVIDLSNLRRSK